jgi:hypothetical protein
MNDDEPGLKGKVVNDVSMVYFVFTRLFICELSAL